MIDKWTSRNHEKDARNNTVSADEGGIICHTAEKIKRRSLSYDLLYLTTVRSIAEILVNRCCQQSYYPLIFTNCPIKD